MVDAAQAKNLPAGRGGVSDAGYAAADPGAATLAT
jgi:hypothetical protein